MKIVLKGRPISTGSIYKSVCRGKFPTVYMTPEGKSLKESYAWQAKSQVIGPPSKGELSVVIGLYFDIKRKCDIDNFHKLSLDSLTGIAWEDDSQITSMNVTKHYDKEYPRIEIEIESKG